MDIDNQYLGSSLCTMYKSQHSTCAFCWFSVVN